MKINFTYTKFIFLVAVILVAIVVIIIWSLLNSSPTSTTSLQPTPTPIISTVIRSDEFPTSAPTPTFTQIPLRADLKEKLISQMPRNTTTYDIEYLTKSDTFVITIKKSPYNTNQMLAEKWIMGLGINNLKSLNILYNKRLLVE